MGRDGGALSRTMRLRPEEERKGSEEEQTGAMKWEGGI